MVRDKGVIWFVFHPIVPTNTLTLSRHQKRAQGIRRLAGSRPASREASEDRPGTRCERASDTGTCAPIDRPPLPTARKAAGGRGPALICKPINAIQDGQPTVRTYKVGNRARTRLPFTVVTLESWKYRHDTEVARTMEKSGLCYRPYSKRKHIEIQRHILSSLASVREEERRKGSVRTCRDNNLRPRHSVLHHLTTPFRYPFLHASCSTVSRYASEPSHSLSSEVLIRHPRLQTRPTRGHSMSFISQRR